jgi:hypothetical protein
MHGTNTASEWETHGISAASSTLSGGHRLYLQIVRPFRIIFCCRGGWKQYREEKVGDAMHRLRMHRRYQASIQLDDNENERSFHFGTKAEAAVA